jgi:hypothetical protein
MQHKSLNQLLCAATVNGRFCETLLRNPAKALATGYCEHTFALTPEEQELVLGIQAQRLEDFAAQVHRWLSINGNGNGHKQGSRVRRESVSLYINRYLPQGLPFGQLPPLNVADEPVG